MNKISEYLMNEHVMIDEKGRISTKNGPSIVFILKTWIIHKLVGSAVHEQRAHKESTKGNTYGWF
jgi:hypothetical protein